MSTATPGARLELLQALRDRLDAEQDVFKADLARAARALIQPGLILQRHAREFGTITVARGNDRRAAAYEVMTEPTVERFDPRFPELARVRVEAYPLNDSGKRMSGRAGNTRSYTGKGQNDTISLHIEVVPWTGLEDKRSGNALLLEFFDRAARAQAAEAAS